MNEASHNKGYKTLRYGMLVPLSLLIASIAAGYFSYSDARRTIAENLNHATIAITDKNRGLWTRQDTVAALCQLNEATNRPLIFRISETYFGDRALKGDAYLTLTVLTPDYNTNNANTNNASGMSADKIVSDSIMLITGNDANCVTIQVRGYTDCSMASVFAASDQALPGVLFGLSLLSTALLFMTRRRTGHVASPGIVIASLKLTPMQRRFLELLIDAPDMRVDKRTLCATLWDNKSNAEESLYTLVRRTKVAIADSGIGITCNRGDSYELRINA